MERFGIMFSVLLACCIAAKAVDAYYLGCANINTTNPICKQDSGLTLRGKSLAYAIEWLRQQQSDGLWHNTPHNTGLVLSHLAVSGYVNDENTCSGSLEKSRSKILSMFQEDPDSLTELNGGRLALVILGLKATCTDPKQYVGLDLVELLVQKMKKFPHDGFNNYYQYSLGIIALASADKYIDDSFLEKLLTNVFLGNGKKIKGSFGAIMNDTRLMGVLALQAAHRQKFHPHWYAKHVNRELRKAHKALKQVLKNFDRMEKNIVTVAHMMQVLFSSTGDLQKVPGCGRMYGWLLKHQDETGSFGGVPQTAYVLPALAGKSLLDVINVDCGRKPDQIQDSSIRKFIALRKTKAKKANTVKETSSQKFIEVAVSLEYGNPANSVSASFRIRAGSTAFDALLIAGGINNCFRATYTKTVWGPMIDSICGQRQDHSTKSYWMFYVNGNKAKTGPSSYILQQSDNISFKLEKWVG